MVKTDVKSVLAGLRLVHAQHLEDLCLYQDPSKCAVKIVSTNITFKLKNENRL